MIESTPGSCDSCLGSSFERYLQATPCGRELVRCAGCGLVLARPCRGGAAAPAPPGRDPRTDARRAAAVMRILPSGRVLEIGCGEGGFLAALDPSRYEVAGVEHSEREAARAVERLGSAGARGAALVGRITDVRLPAESFDLVALFGALCRTPSPRATLMEAARLLRGGGYAVIETPSLSSLTARLCGSRWLPLHDPTADYFFTPSSLQRLAAVCGFLPGAAWLPLPAAWPAPGTLVVVARKSAAAIRAPALGELRAGVSRVGKATPLGATH